MRRSLAAGAAVLSGLALVVSPVAAQDEVVTVTGVSRCVSVGEEGVGTSFHGLEFEEGALLECAFEMSDPRVSGTQTAWFSEQCPPKGDPCLLWGASVIEGPEGTWDCTDIHMEPAPTFDNDFAIAVCTGTGGYAGLTFIWQATQSGWMDSDHWGYIYEGPPPVEIVPVLVPTPTE